MTPPLTIEIMLFYCTSGSGQDFPRIDAPACREAVVALKEAGLLTGGSPQVYRVTDVGRAWVAMLCGTPFPEVVIVDPRSNKPVSSV